MDNQTVTIDINNKMLDLNNKLLKLTDESLDGNTTVRIVNLVTLIYLPASFVSVSTILQKSKICRVLTLDITRPSLE